MNILLTIHSELDAYAGAPGVTLKLAEQYERLGHAVKIFSYDDLPGWLPRIIQDIFFPAFVAFHIFYLMLSWELDVVHSSSVDAWLWGRLVSPFCMKNSPLLIAQSHGLEHTLHFGILKEVDAGNIQLSWKYPLYRGSLLLWQAAESFRVADFSFVLNQYDAQYLEQHLRVDAERIHVFPNGIPDEFIKLPFKVDSLLNGSSLGIALVSSYIDRKGIRYSVPALVKVLMKYSHVTVAFLGTGCPEGKVLADFPEKLHSRIKIVPSFLKPELPDLLSQSQVFLFPSLSEGFPLALPEAMANGLAPIVSDIPGPTEIVVDQENGLVVPSRDSTAIELAIESLILNPTQLKLLRLKAYQDAQHYNWETVGKSHVKLYEEATENVD